MMVANVERYGTIDAVATAVVDHLLVVIQRRLLFTILLLVLLGCWVSHGCAQPVRLYFV